MWLSVWVTSDHIAPNTRGSPVKRPSANFGNCASSPVAGRCRSRESACPRGDSCRPATRRPGRVVPVLGRLRQRSVSSEEVCRVGGQAVRQAAVTVAVPRHRLRIGVRSHSSGCAECSKMRPAIMARPAAFGGRSSSPHQRRNRLWRPWCATGRDNNVRPPKPALPSIPRSPSAPVASPLQSWSGIGSDEVLSVLLAGVFISDWLMTLSAADGRIAMETGMRLFDRLGNYLPTAAEAALRWQPRSGWSSGLSTSTHSFFCSCFEELGIGKSWMTCWSGCGTSARAQEFMLPHVSSFRGSQ